MKRTTWTVAWFTAALIGCAHHAPPSLDSQMFSPRASLQPLHPAAGASTLPATEPLAVASTQPALPASQPTEVSSTPPATEPVPPTTQVLQTGSYMTLGGVVAEVNGNPIYANKVLSLLEPEFSVKAKEMDAESFRAFAWSELKREREGLIADEAFFAAAQRELSSDDKKLVEQMAMPAYRQKLITQAGGSIELARQKARADQRDLDEMMQDYYRHTMFDLFRERRITPRIHVSADDVRAFYNQNVDRLYTEHDQAKFRLIKIDPARIGGDQAKRLALLRAAEIRSKAMAGADFTTLASTENQDDYLRAHGGDPGGWMERGSYRIDAVNKAIWKIAPGQVTDVIEDGGMLYIAKLEDRKLGRVRPFDDPALQTEIFDKLWHQQFAVLQTKMYQDLEREAIIRSDDSMLKVALDLVMQKYPQWAVK